MIYSMPEALWARVQPLLATIDPTPPANARALLEALIYPALSGGRGDDLPAAYPAAGVVAAAAARWRALGLFDHLAAVLLALAPPAPGAAVGRAAGKRYPCPSGETR
jgi:transposase